MALGRGVSLMVLGRSRLHLVGRWRGTTPPSSPSQSIQLNDIPDSRVLHRRCFLCWPQRRSRRPESGGCARLGRGQISRQSLASMTVYGSDRQYIINMIRLKIPILPSILTAGLLLSLFSSASAMAFAASRTLYSLALQQQAPRFLLRTNRSGLPYLCVLASLSLGALSYLALSSGTRTGENTKLPSRAGS